MIAIQNGLRVMEATFMILTRLFVVVIVTSGKFPVLSSASLEDKGALTLACLLVLSGAILSALKTTKAAFASHEQIITTRPGYGSIKDCIHEMRIITSPQ